MMHLLAFAGICVVHNTEKSTIITDIQECSQLICNSNKCQELARKTSVIVFMTG